MDNLENLKIALRSIRSNLLRSLLTLSIVALGIMALVGIITAIDSLQASISSELSGLGANSFTIDRTGSNVRGGRGRRVKYGDPISYRDAEAFKERYDFPAQVMVSQWATGGATVRYEDEKSNPNVTVTGIDENYLDVQGYDIAAGRAISITEVQNGSPTALVGEEIVKTLFGGKNERAVDRVISVNNIKYRITGVLASKGASSNNNDRIVLVPLLSTKRYYGTDRTNYNVAVQVADAATMEDAISSATGVMRQVRSLSVKEENDFVIEKSDSMVGIVSDISGSLKIGAVVIGLITLAGAAIGLMNIMLVTVTERTREIGIRKALGATSSNVLRQFLIEAVLICVLGGLTGILLGVLMGNAVASFIGGVFVLPVGWLVFGLVVCVITGVISGFYPALKASRMDPIESLRYE